MKSVNFQKKFEADLRKKYLPDLETEAGLVGLVGVQYDRVIVKVDSTKEDKKTVYDQIRKTSRRTFPPQGETNGGRNPDMHADHAPPCHQDKEKVLQKDHASRIGRGAGGITRHATSSSRQGLLRPEHRATPPFQEIRALVKTKR